MQVPVLYKNDSETMFYCYCSAIKTILMAVPLVGAHGRKNSLRFAAAIFYVASELQT